MKPYQEVLWLPGESETSNLLAQEVYITLAYFGHVMNCNRMAEILPGNFLPAPVTLLIKWPGLEA
jgi:hypothetical protein